MKIFSQISFWYRLSIAGGATLLIGMGLGRFSFSPLIPALIETGILTSQEAGIIAASNFAGYLFGALSAPFVRLFFGEIGSMKCCLVLALLSLFACILPWGFWWLVFWRALLGGLVGIMMIYCLAIATRFAPKGKLGAATGIVYTGVGIGIFLSGSLIPWLLSFSLAIAWLGIASIGLIAFMVAFWGWTSPIQRTVKVLTFPKTFLIKNLNGIQFSSHADNEIIALYERKKHKIDEIINIIKKEGVEIIDISTDDGDLEDVFIQLTKN